MQILLCWAFSGMWIHATNLKGAHDTRYARKYYCHWRSFLQWQLSCVDNEGDVPKLRSMNKAEKWNKMHNEDFIPRDYTSKLINHYILEASMSNNHMQLDKSLISFSIFQNTKKVTVFGWFGQTTKPIWLYNHKMRLIVKQKNMHSQFHPKEQIKVSRVKYQLSGAAYWKLAGGLSEEIGNWKNTLTTVWLNQEMRPYLFKYPAIAMRAANHVRVSQATPSAKHSFHVTTPVTRSTDNPRIAADTASTLRSPPNTQSPTWWVRGNRLLSNQRFLAFKVPHTIHLIKTQGIQQYSYY